MNITSAQYVQGISGEAASIKAVIDTEVVHVPINEDNRHYQAILEWVAEGNTIQEAD